MVSSVKQYTDIGFKRVVNRLNPLESGYVRCFIKCKKCKTNGYYDYMPYSLSNPLRWAECGHDLKNDYREF